MKPIKAARIHNYGGPEVVRVESTSSPALNPETPGPADSTTPEKSPPKVNGGGTGIICCKNAAGVNPIDWKIRAGYADARERQTGRFRMNRGAVRDIAHKP